MTSKCHPPPCYIALMPSSLPRRPRATLYTRSRGDQKNSRTSCLNHHCFFSVTKYFLIRKRALLIIKVSRLTKTRGSTFTKLRNLCSTYYIDLESVLVLLIKRNKHQKTGNEGNGLLISLCRINTESHPLLP